MVAKIIRDIKSWVQKEQVISDGEIVTRSDIHGFGGPSVSLGGGVCGDQSKCALIFHVLTPEVHNFSELFMSSESGDNH